MAARLLDHECLMCGGPIVSNQPHSKTCSRDCSAALRTLRHRQRKLRLKQMRDALMSPRGIGVPDDDARRCADCGSTLSAYNRGRFCHACWSGYSVRKRTSRGGRG